MSTDDFTSLLESKSRRVRRWATLRHIEQQGYHCQNWYDGYDIPFSAKELTLERYLGGPGSVPSDPTDPTSSGRDQNLDYWATFGGEVWNHVFGELDWVDEKIMRFGQANLTGLKTLIKDIDNLPTLLRGDDSWRDSAGLSTLEHFEGGYTGLPPEGKPGDILLESAMEELCNWSGATAVEYTRAFGRNGEEWEQIAYNNYALGEYVISAAEAQLAVFVTIRESVDNVCDKTIEALWGVNESEGDNGLALILTVVGSVLAIGLTVASMGAAAPATAAALGAASSLVSSGFGLTSAVVSAATSGSGNIDSGAPGEEIEISGDTAMDVLDSMSTHLDKVIDVARDKETEIKEALESAVSAVDASRSAFEIIFPEGTPSDDMGEREVALSTGDLEHVATTLFPRSAYRMHRAHSVLADSTGEYEAFQSEFNPAATAAYRPWTNLRDLLQDLTASNGAKIEYAGGFLLRYAIEMDVVDGLNAEDFRRLLDNEDVKRLPGPN